MIESNLILLISIAVGLMLLLVISLILFFSFSQKKIIAEKERNHQQKMDFQKEMLASSVITQEEERQRIARELHDDISSKLNVINLNMNFLRTKLTGEEHLDVFSDISSSLELAIDRSRKISHELMPPILDKFGLSAAMTDLAHQVSLSGEVRCDIKGKENLDLFKGEKKLHIFRIIQELINNTLKHAGAKNIHIQSTLDHDYMTINYMDDGKGLDPKQKSSGIGTLNIETRIQLLNAKWKILPSENGVNYKIDIPNEQKVNFSR